MYKKSDRIALFISVLLHSVLIFFPQPEEPLPLTESPPLTDSIAVVELPIPPAPEPQTLPTPVVPPSPPEPVVPPSPPEPVIPPSPPAPVVPPSPPVATPADPPEDLPPEAPRPETINSPTDQPEPDLPPEVPNTETSNNPVDQPEPEPEPEPDPEPDLPPDTTSPETSDDAIDEAKIEADWKNLVSHLQSQNQEFDYYEKLYDLFKTFGEPERVNQFFDDGQPKLDVSSFYLFPEQTPERVWQEVVEPELTSNTGFEPQRQENVPVGLAYQLSQGEMLHYLIIVQLNEHGDSVLMVTDSLLGLES